MAANSKKAVQNGNSKEDNVFLRVLHLPVVNSACISIQKTYATTKEAHPLMASVCQAYERGVQSATSLAVWSVKPVVQMLEPQFAAANTLACRGLDHLEQRIPALQEPVEKVTSDLKDSISTYIQSATRSMADSMDRIWGLAADGYELSESTVRDTVEYARTSPVSQMAEAGVDATISNLEKLVAFLFPKPECQPGQKPPKGCASKEKSPTNIFSRLRTLASTISQHAYKQTVQTIQYTRDKGQELASWIPSLTAKSTAAQALMDNQAQNLQSVFLSAISSMKKAPFAAWNVVGQLLHVSPLKAVSEASAKVGKLPETLHSVTGSLLGTISRYVPLPRILVTAKETAGSDQAQKDGQPVATDADEKEPHYKQRDWRRSSRGHLPLPFLNMDDPLPDPAPVQSRSPALEAEHAGTRRSAFSPYKEAAGSRRWSEGLFRPGAESVAYIRAHYASTYSTTKKN
ncbi:perilipin-1 [Tiliqua scincoides]|uniref:perilipin-1 n=1 Tax=Tiliqua scincoides TaxID=71010 RepID=UPI0034623039